MIGGRDIIIPIANGAAALETAVRAVTRLWPDVVLEDAATGESLRNRADMNLDDHHEILAFRDSRSAELWDDLGADPSLDGTLIHFLLSNDALTVAIDSYPPPEIESFVDGLRRSLNPLQPNPV
jgi:hypothetical protein